MKRKIEEILKESIRVKEKMLSQVEDILRITQFFLSTLKRGGRILLFGNGGSAADAQHIAGELVGRFRKERKGIPALALTVNPSILTSVGNDYSFEEIFSRQIEAIGRKEDLAVGISTTGNSPNVIKGILKAKELGMKTVGLSGGEGGKLKEVADFTLIVPSKETPRIQEVHITIGHIICELVEEGLES